MRYYIYQIEFINQEGKACKVSTPNSCDEADFDANLVETKAIVFDQAKALNNDEEVTTYSESIIDIPQVDYIELANPEE
jgi:hypothetical protein